VLNYTIGYINQSYNWDFTDSSAYNAFKRDDLLAIKGHRPLTYHIIMHIAIGKKETMTIQGGRLFHIPATR